MIRRSVILTTAAVVSAVGLATVVALPAAADWYGNRHQETGTYATGAEAKSARASVPRWLADDATSVQYAMRTTGGDRLLTATLPDERLPTSCTTEPRPRAQEVPLAQDWFPKDARGKATARCGLYYAYMDGTTLYAWQHNDDWLRAERTAAAR
ncbi:hypothetical protein [Streptomyces sp. NPDC057686]|uniref:hypothetical protein n=1 Tax=Streptomyces sp. NPDC057686 TaxID=3346212 RepID=UPI0036B41535